jgi:hypothetical protein
MRISRIELGVWLERLTTVAVVVVATASMYRVFWAPFSSGRTTQGSFSQFQKTADMLQRELDPAKRENEILSGKCRLSDARIPANARVFLLDMLKPENAGKMGYYYFLTYYLYPREVAISLGQPPTFQLDGVTGRSPVSLKELKQAGYDFAAQINTDKSGDLVTLGLLPLGSPEAKPKPIPGGDGIPALLLPLAVAITGSRLVRWLFRDLTGVLTTGELLASGLAVGAFFLTQLTLALRLAGARWERALTTIVLVWAGGELALWFRRRRGSRPQLKVQYLWWLLLVPAALMLWCQFRLAGLLGLQEYDAVAFWAFKAKILYYSAGKEMWPWFKNPALAYAHLDYPLLVSLLHTLTYGMLGHVNEFVTKFWNQWMLLLLVWAVLGAGRFPGKRPWLAAAVATAVVLLPMTREYALTEGGTLPMLFYTVLSSLQLAMGMMEQQAGRLRLGLLLLLALAMVKLEGMILLGFWSVVLLLDRDSRAALWPARQVGWAGLLGLAAWLPYVVFRLHGPVPHPESGWLSLLIRNAGAVFHILPMTWVAMLSRRFLNNEFAFWNSANNQHAVWQGHWTGWSSLVDQWTQGAGWVCLLLLAVAWGRGGRLRGTVIRLFLVFLAFTTVVSLLWSAVHSSPLDYTLALDGSIFDTGGRYLYPVLLAWLVAGVVLLLRTLPGESADSDELEKTSVNGASQSCGGK